MNKKYAKLPSLMGLAIFGILLSNVLSSYVWLASSFQGMSYWYEVFKQLLWPLLIVIIPFLGLLPLLVHILKTYPLREGKLYRFIGLHLGIILVFAIAQISIHMLFEPQTTQLYEGDSLYRFIRGTLDYFGYSFGLYTLAVAAYFATTYFRQLKLKELNESRLSEALTIAKLNTLKMKLQPHFLFNALQSINVLILQGLQDKASEMIEKLSILLRIAIDNDDEQLVTVEKELETLGHYLDIELIRFEDKLTIEKDIPESLNLALIPGLLLQPLIENALKHGISQRIEAGVIRISFAQDTDSLELTIWNNGPQISQDWSLKNNSGVGLEATARRLSLLYPKAHELSLFNHQSDGVTCLIRIPYYEEIQQLKRGAKR